MEMEQVERLSSRLWHTQDTVTVQDALQTTSHGLSQQEATQRLRTYGENRLPQAKPRFPLIRFLLQFHNVLVYVLLVAASITAFLGDWIDTGVILAVLLVNAFIGFIQEGKAQKALEAIRSMLSLQANVLRDGHRHQVPAELIVPGDLALLQAGDKVPADLRLLEVKNLAIQEAALTGESEVVEKTTSPAPEQASLGDRTCMAYTGTIVTRGQATGIVVATGGATEIGRISESLARIEQLSTPLLRQIAGLGRWLTAGILGLAALTFLSGWLLHAPPYAST